MGRTPGCVARRHTVVQPAQRGITEAQAIRITDQSGRTLDNYFKASASPAFASSLLESR